MRQPNEYYLNKLIGLTYEKAKEICDKDEFHLRITSKDGKGYIVTNDFIFDRINVDIKNEKIIKVSLG